MVYKRSTSRTFIQSWSPLHILAFAKAGLSQTCATLRLPSQSSPLFYSVPLSFLCPIQRVHPNTTWTHMPPEATVWVIHLSKANTISYVKYSNFLFQSTYKVQTENFNVVRGSLWKILITQWQSELQVRIFIELLSDHKLMINRARGTPTASARYVRHQIKYLSFNNSWNCRYASL